MKRASWSSKLGSACVACRSMGAVIQAIVCIHYMHCEWALKRGDTAVPKNSDKRCRYWMVDLDGVAVGGQRVPQLKADGAVMDTGTSLITTGSGDAMRVNSVRGQ